MADQYLPPTTVHGRTPSIRAIALAVLLGLMAGFVHGWNLSLVGLLLLVVFFNVRARLFIAVWGVGVALSWLLLPISYVLGRFVLDSTPIGGLLGLLSENPVVPMFGLDRYTVVGGGILAVVLFVPTYFTARGWMRAVRTRIQQRRMRASASQTDESTSIDIPNTKGRISPARPHFVKAANEESAPRLVRRFGAVGLLFGIGVVSAGIYVRAPREAAIQILNSLADMNGAEVNAGQIGLDFWSGRLEIRNLAFADPTNLNEDRLQIGQLSGLIDVAALLRGRLELDQVQCGEVNCHVQRSRPAWGAAGRLSVATNSCFDAADLFSTSGDDTELALSECVESWDQTQRGIAGVGQLLSQLERLRHWRQAGVDAGRKLPRFALLSSGRSQLGAPRPLVWIRSLVVEGLAPECGLGDQTVVRFADVNSDAARCPRPTQIEIWSPEQGLDAQIVLAGNKQRRRHQIRLQVNKFQIANCQLGCHGTQALRCQGGLAAVSAAGWFDGELLDLKLIVQDRDLALQVSDEFPCADSATEELNRKLTQRCRLRLAARLRGSCAEPKLSIEPNGIRDYVDRRARIIGTAAVAQKTQASEPGATTVVTIATGQPPQSAEASMPNAAIAEGITDLPAIDPAIPSSTESQVATLPPAETDAVGLSQPMETTGPQVDQAVEAFAATAVAPQPVIERLPPIALASATETTGTQSEHATTSVEPATVNDVSVKPISEKVAMATTPELGNASITFSPPANQQFVSPQANQQCIVCQTPAPAPEPAVSSNPAPGSDNLAADASAKPKAPWWEQKFDRPADSDVMPPMDPEMPVVEQPEPPSTFGKWARTQFNRAANAWPFRRKVARNDEAIMSDYGTEMEGDREQARVVRQTNDYAEEVEIDPR